jgi:ribosomal protein L34E
MRTSFFSCSLVSKANLSPEEAAKEREFQAYIAPFVNSKVEDKTLAPSRIADARHAFLEFSQYRNLEFDTLRRAKYSTSILLYHLHYDEAPGLIPTCSSCEETIHEIRWHRIRRVEERHHTGRVPPTLRAARLAQIGVDQDTAEAIHYGEELCANCYDKRSTKEEFIPLPVSFKA